MQGNSVLPSQILTLPSLLAATIYPCQDTHRSHSFDDYYVCLCAPGYTEGHQYPTDTYLSLHCLYLLQRPQSIHVRTLIGPTALTTTTFACVGYTEGHQCPTDTYLSLLSPIYYSGHNLPMSGHSSVPQLWRLLRLPVWGIPRGISVLQTHTYPYSLLSITAATIYPCQDTHRSHSFDDYYVCLCGVYRGASVSYRHILIPTLSYLLQRPQSTHVRTLIGPTALTTTTFACVGYTEGHQCPPDTYLSLLSPIYYSGHNLSMSGHSSVRQLRRLLCLPVCPGIYREILHDWHWWVS